MSMTPKQVELARRLVAHPKFEDRGGMRAERVYDHETYTAQDLPDLGDCATKGRLLEMLQQPFSIHCSNEGSAFVWCVLRRTAILASDEPDLGTALATALLKQWEEP